MDNKSSLNGELFVARLKKIVEKDVGHEIGSDSKLANELNKTISMSASKLSNLRNSKASISGKDLLALSERYGYSTDFLLGRESSSLDDSQTFSMRDYCLMMIRLLDSGFISLHYSDHVLTEKSNMAEILENDNYNAFLETFSCFRTLPATMDYDNPRENFFLIIRGILAQYSKYKEAGLSQHECHRLIEEYIGHIPQTADSINIVIHDQWINK